MAINKESSVYTFIFATVMVIVVGTALALAYKSLKPFQDENERMFKMKSMLEALRIETEMKEAPELFKKHVVKSILLDHTGKVVYESPVKDSVATENDPAFSLDIKKQYKDKTIPENKRLYPLFECETEDGPMYLTSVVGKGLWGPIWGFLSIQKDDMETIYGAAFDHKTETPGLGAEIKTGIFEEPYQGKKVSYTADKFITIKVLKAGKVPDIEGQSYVNGITGGTITSNGVDEMVDRTLTVYSKYFLQLKNN